LEHIASQKNDEPTLDHLSWLVESGAAMHLFWKPVELFMPKLNTPVPQ
jgi:hypothetical protein